MFSTATVAHTTTYAGGRGNASRTSARSRGAATEPRPTETAEHDARRDRGHRDAGLRRARSRRVPRRRSRRHARRSSAYASNDAQAGDSNTTSPGCGEVGGALDRVVHRAARRRPGRTSVERGRDLGCRLAERDDGADVIGAVPRARARSRPLLRPPASSTTESNAATRVHGRVRVRRLRIVDVLHPTMLADQRDAVGHGLRTSASASLDAGLGRADLERRGRRRERVRDDRAAARGACRAIAANARPSGRARGSPSRRGTRRARSVGRNRDGARRRGRRRDVDATGSSAS